MTDEEKRKIVDALNNRGVGKVCPMCGRTKFSVAEGYLTDSLSDGYMLESGHRIIPSILIICSNCGFMSRHALGALGLLEEFTSKSGEMDGNRWLKAAIYWINDMAYPNEGMTHPLDDDKLKSVANMLASMNVDINEKVVRETAQSLHITNDSIIIILEAFKKAKLNKFKTMDRFPEDFLKERLKGIAKENGL